MNRPTVSPPRPWTFPAARRTRMPNGLRAATVQLPGRHVATVILVLDAPLSGEPAGLDGVAAVMAETFELGTERCDAQEFAAETEQAGATWSPGVDHLGPRVTVDVPVSRLARALRLLAEAVRAPAFCPDQVALSRGRSLAALAQDRADPRARAALEFPAAVIAPPSRAARRIGGDETSLQRIGASDVAAFHGRWVGPDRTTVVLAGDFTGVDTDALLDASFGDWAGAPEPAPPAERPAALPGPRSVVVDRPGAVQTQFVLGCFATDRRDPDWPALGLAANILGAGVGSRVDTALRGERGYTYGTDTRFIPMRCGGTFAVSGAVRTDATGPALRELVDILGAARHGGFTPAECDSARSAIAGTVPFTYETARAVAHQWAEIVAAGLEEDYIDAHLAAVGSVSENRVSEAFARHVDTDALTLVAVGDADHIAAFENDRS